MSLQVVTAKLAEVELREAVVAPEKVSAEGNGVQTKDVEPTATTSAEEVKQHHLPPLSTAAKDAKSAMKRVETAQNGDTFNADGTVMEAPRTVKKVRRRQPDRQILSASLPHSLTHSVPHSSPSRTPVLSTAAR